MGEAGEGVLRWLGRCSATGGVPPPRGQLRGERQPRAQESSNSDAGIGRLIQ